MLPKDLSQLEHCLTEFICKKSRIDEEYSRILRELHSNTISKMLPLNNGIPHASRALLTKLLSNLNGSIGRFERSSININKIGAFFTSQGLQMEIEENALSEQKINLSQELSLCLRELLRKQTVYRQSVDEALRSYERLDIEKEIREKSSISTQLELENATEHLKMLINKAELDHLFYRNVWVSANKLHEHVDRQLFPLNVTFVRKVEADIRHTMRSILSVEQGEDLRSLNTSTDQHAVDGLTLPPYVAPTLFPFLFFGNMVDVTKMDFDRDRDDTIVFGCFARQAMDTFCRDQVERVIRRLQE